MAKQIEIINGPNLNLTGRREQDIYGSTTFDQYLDKLRRRYPEVHIGFYQSNVEGELINRIQAVGFSADGIILNAGGYSHTSVAIHDALKAVTCPAVEVHISNIFACEDYRHHSLITPACRGIIAGFGLEGYALALEALLQD